MSCTSSTGLGRPVVPEVNEMAATPAGDAGASASSGAGASHVPSPVASTTGHVDDPRRVVGQRDDRRGTVLGDHVRELVGRRGAG